MFVYPSLCLGHTPYVIKWRMSAHRRPLAVSIVSKVDDEHNRENDADQHSRHYHHSQHDHSLAEHRSLLCCRAEFQQ